MTEFNSLNKKIKFTESEQELYDAILDEYNDIFENIFNIKENQIFEKILTNAKAILGEKKMENYSKSIISKVISFLKISNYIPDISSLKPLKKYILHLKKNNNTHKIQSLEIDDIFAHCKGCSKCYHVCGEVLLKPSKYDYIICLKCNMIYKKNLIHLYCQECNEEYYSYIVDDSEPDYDNYYPATWEKYHCRNFIYEEMTCPECEAMLYYNEDIQLLKCFECNWKCNANNKKWICELCDAEFTSPVKEYIRFETKPMVNCVRDALVQKIFAHPLPGFCCGVDQTQFIFRHINNDNEKKCNGILYLGHLQKKEVIVCSECRLVRYMKEVHWECPNCLKIFVCKKRKDIKKVKHKSNNNITKFKNILKDEKICVFQPKKIHGFQKSAKRYENVKSNEKDIKINNNNINNNNNCTRLRKMEKSNTSSLFEPIGKIISKKIKPLNGKTNKINITNIKNNKSNDDGKTYSNNGNDGDISDSENSSNDDKAKSINTQNKLKTKYKNAFSFYKKPTNNLYNNIVKLKKKEKSENISFNNEFNEKFYQTANNMNCPHCFMKKKDSSEIHNRNYSLKDIKLLSLRNQKYISRSKMKFAKSSNENSLISIKNMNTDNHLLTSENKNKVGQIKTKLIHSGKKINLNLNLNININNFVDRSHSNDKNSIENNLRDGSINKNINVKNVNNSDDVEDPNENFDPNDFKIIKQIGEGTFGRIYCSEWKKNNKNYAMKKMILKNKIEIKKNKIQTDLVYNFLKKTNNKGVIQVYGSQCNKINDNEYNFYVLMELAEIDWEKEIKKRKELKNYYTEGELYEITRQLIKTFALLQKNNITHRDIKPQNILIVNNIYKICDFGEAKITEGNSIIRQTIKGTELYMSPILFRALNKRQNFIIHNTFKSDVFSLGMCLLLASTLTFKSLYEIRELKDMNLIKKILEKYLIVKYSYNFVNILIKMLEVNENLRPDFIELDTYLYQK